MKFRGSVAQGVWGILVLIVSLAVGCSSTTTIRGTKDKPEGLFARFMDRITERECLTGRFTCPYGWGPANEPCDCTDPDGRVWKGRTIK
jgi:hypothetical protein